jgi:hypothetical protein
MKFLIQKINGEIRHDFAFTLLESIRFKNWLSRNDKKDKIKVKFIEYSDEIPEPSDIYPMPFKPMHKDYVPIGSVEFVSDFLMHFHNLKPEPINVPEELFGFAKRYIFNDSHLGLENQAGKFFVKSNDKIKGFAELVECFDNGNQGTKYSIPIPVGAYQFSEYIRGIESEWRVFVYEDKMVGLQNYTGDFTVFPNINRIKQIINAFEVSGSAPIAYTLDVGVTDHDTIIIEVHDFFSCGLYGFANHGVLPHMFYRWFEEYLFINF